MPSEIKLADGIYKVDVNDFIRQHAKNPVVVEHLKVDNKLHLPIDTKSKHQAFSMNYQQPNTVKDVQNASALLRDFETIIIGNSASAHDNEKAQLNQLMK